MSLPSVIINIADNGSNAAVSLPQQNVQVVLGCGIAANPSPVPVATTNPATLVTNFVAGQIVEAAGLVCAAGSVVIAVPLPIASVGTATAVVATVPGGSSTVVTVTLDGTAGAYDDYYVMLKCVTAGTRGTAGIQFQISLDAGRNFGAIIALGTATTYAIPNTGITLNFAAGTLAVSDYWRFSTTAPKWNAAGVQAAITALIASPYALAGWGSMHLVGACTAGDVANVQGYIEAMAPKYVFSRILTSSRDALAPVAWGGSGETETTWITSLQTAFAATSAKRVVVGAGYYNTPTPFPNAAAGTPSYRRPLTWSDAVRRTLVPPQRKGGAVSDGSLTNIIVNPASDPGDGFIYHDERVNQGLDAARFMSAITWAKRQGFYICHENLMSPTGSQFTELVYGNVIDVACDIGYSVGVDEISNDLNVKDSGVLQPTDALTLQSKIDGGLAEGMINVAMVSNAYSSVSQTANVGATSNIPVGISVKPRGYANTLTETINLVP